ncbi:MAG: hypothetical protein JEZ06_01330 [Anaerolineaceae bacterium]|nr:hypothetical protein [Anaerolineaceae bacterium]
MMNNKRIFWLLSIFILGLSIAIFSISPSVQASPLSEEPTPVPEHSWMAEYNGSETCTTCHKFTGKEVAESVHYQLQGPALTTEGLEDSLQGMMNTTCELPASNAAINWIGVLQPQDSSKPPVVAGCSQCHIGMGAKPNDVDQLTEADYNNIDCLICHGPNYSATTIETEEGFARVPAQGVDVLTSALNAQLPTTEMCLSCHAKAGGGLNHKHGVVPTAESDVHIAAGLGCLDCHQSEDHKFAHSSDMKATDPTREEAELPAVQCINCHSESLHGNVVINQHTEAIACQTCHIPMIARDESMPTVVYRDYSEAIYNETTGLYGPKNEMALNVLPVYHRWNGKITVPPGPAESGTEGKIFPWKVTVVNLPVDSETQESIPIKKGIHYVTGDIEKAVTAGVEAYQAIEPAFAYSGSFEMAEETLKFSVNHQVAPSSEALTCSDCHSEDGRLDFALLAYSEENAAGLTQFPPVFVREEVEVLEENAEVEEVDVEEIEVSEEVIVSEEIIEEVIPLYEPPTINLVDEDKSLEIPSTLNFVPWIIITLVFVIVIFILIKIGHRKAI